MSSRLCVLVSAFAAVLVIAGTAAPSASAASSCAAQGFTVAPLQSNVFYIDVAQDYLGSYVGYRLTNTSGSHRAGLWMRLESFRGGVVRPADGDALTAPVPLADLAGGASTPAYAYLKADEPTTVPQGHDVVVYDGRPGSAATEICRESQSIVAVEDVIKASANKVTGVSLSTASPSLGGIFELTVTGATGTIGAGSAHDPGVVRFSPAVADNWPSSAFQLVGVSHRLPASGGALVDVLSRSGLSGWHNTAYSVTYTFRVVGPTATSTPVVPVQNIASGAQVKHTDPASLGALPRIPAVTSSATMAVAAAWPGPYIEGASVPLTVTVSNAGSESVALDRIALSLPAGWSYEAGSARQGAVAIDDPHNSGDGHLTLVGPFTIPGSSMSTFTIVATAGASGMLSATGGLAGGQIDATASATDDSPATTTLTVVAGDDPNTGGAEPPVGGDESATGGDEPATGGDQPPAGGDQPATGGDQPADGGDQPATGGDQPPAGDDQPPAGGDPPATGGDQPTTGGDAPATGGEDSGPGGGTATGGGDAADGNVGVGGGAAVGGAGSRSAPRVGACVSRRVMTIRFKVPSGTALRRLRVSVSGQPTRALPVSARSVRVDLRGRRHETVRVRLIGMTTRGRVTATRTYRLCRPRLTGRPLRTLRLLP